MPPAGTLRALQLPTHSPWATLLLLRGGQDLCVSWQTPRPRAEGSPGAEGVCYHFPTSPYQYSPSCQLWWHSGGDLPARTITAVGLIYSGADVFRCNSAAGMVWRWWHLWSG